MIAKIKEKVDAELEVICFTPHMRENIMATTMKKSSSRKYRIAVLLCAIIMLTGGTVFAAEYVLNQIKVNEETLPKLDEMCVVDADLFLKDNYDTYASLLNALDVPLLDSSLAETTPGMNVNIQTDYKNYCLIRVNNYIPEKVDENRSAISLEVNLILSEEQLNQGWNEDYLGYYEFVETYISEQGYRVNIIQQTSDKGNLKNGEEGDVTEKCAIFVAKGIRYVLKGRLSLDVLNEVVESMR